MYAAYLCKLVIDVLMMLQTGYPGLNIVDLLPCMIVSLTATF